LAWIVSRVDVGDAPRPVAMELDDRRSLGEGVVARALGDGVETTRLHLFGGRLVEGIAHSHVEAAVDDGDVLVCGMEVGRHLVVWRQAQPDRKLGLLRHVAVEGSDMTKKTEFTVRLRLPPNYKEIGRAHV